MKRFANVNKTGLLYLSQLNMMTTTHNVIVECVLKWEAGEKQQWSTFLLCSESVFPGRITKLQSLEQFEEKIQNSYNERKQRTPSFLLSASCYKKKKGKNKTDFGKTYTTAKHDAQSSESSDESKVWINSGFWFTVLQEEGFLGSM